MALAESPSEIAPGVLLAPERPLRVVPWGRPPGRRPPLRQPRLSLAAVLCGGGSRGAGAISTRILSSRPSGRRGTVSPLGAAARMAEMRASRTNYRDRNAPQARLAQRQPRRLPGYMSAVRLVRRRDQADFYAGEFWASAEFNSATHSTSCVGGGMEDLLLRPLTAGHRADAARRGGCGAAMKISGRSRKGRSPLRGFSIDECAQPAGMLFSPTSPTRAFLRPSGSG